MTKNIVLIALLIGTPFLPIANVCLAQAFNAEVTYVGANKCKQCHKDIYEGWKSTLYP